MNLTWPPIIRRILSIIAVTGILLFIVMMSGLLTGSSGGLCKSIMILLNKKHADNAIFQTILWQIRLPRILLASLVGAALSLGGLVFQCLLRNPLAEPYILGISGGSAIGAIIGIMIGFSSFPGVALTAFTGSMATLLLVFTMTSGKSILHKDSLLLSGVMVNAFCSALILFLISIVPDSRLHNILFWLMGDLSMPDIKQVIILAVMIFPCFLILFAFSHVMNLFLLGEEMAQSMGVHIKSATLILLVVTSFMISATVCQCGLLGFVGLVIPHLFRLVLGPDHRLLIPACLLGGGAYLVFCDILARTIPNQGEMPVGVITAMIGAPVFIFLLRRSK